MKAIVGMLAFPAVCLASAASGNATCSNVRSRGEGGGDPLCVVQSTAPTLLQRRSDVQRIGASLNPDSKPLTVMSWNVLYSNFDCCGGRPELRERLADTIAAKADVAGLQECMSEDELQKALGSRLSKAPGTDSFNCIFYRPGVVDFSGESGRQYLGDDVRDDSSKRYFSWAKMSHQGRDFLMMSTHWCIYGACTGTDAGLRHKKSAERMLQKRKDLGLADFPVIIAADTSSNMNNYDEDIGVQHLLANGFAIAAHGTKAGGVDLIFVSKAHWSIGTKEVGDRSASTYASFTVELTMNTEQDSEAPAPTRSSGKAGDVRPHFVKPLADLCSPYEEWPGIAHDTKCGGCRALVHTEPYEHRCDKYCEGFGHVCISAAEEVSDNCAELYTHRCDEKFDYTSDMLCTCESKARAIEQKSESVSCQSFDHWPDVDGGVTCGRCRALISAPPHGNRCDKYCESFGHVCVAAAEEESDNCEVKQLYECDEVIPDTTDILCTCALPAESHDSTTETPAESHDSTTEAPAESHDSTTEAPAESQDSTTESHDSTTEAPAESQDSTTEAPAESQDSTTESHDSTTEAPAESQDSTTETVPTRVPKTEPEEPATEVISDALTCKPFEQWPSLDGVTCGNCRALVLTAPYEGRCDIYCESFGQICVSAAEEVEDNCEVKYTSPCQVEIAHTSDMLCTCRSPVETSPTPEVPEVPAPEQPSTTEVTTTTVAVTTTTTTVSTEPATLDCCESYRAWPKIDKRVTCGDSCTALVLTEPYGGRCDRYCESFGHVCVAAAEEVAEDCAVKYRTECDVAILDTSDMLCTCKLPSSVGTCPIEAPSTTTPESTTPLPSTTSTPPTSGGPGKRIQVRGRQLLVDGQPLHLKGVAWNPIKKGGRHPNGLNFRGSVERDAQIMAEAGINAVRTYASITDWAVLDILWSHGIWVINGVYSYGGSPASSVVDPVNAVKDHPAILMWTIGNEWNYNGLYVGMGFWDSVARLEEVALLIKQLDAKHPIASVYGELGGLQDVAARLTNVDVWGINIYRGISFGDFFDDFAGLTNKPLFLGEYGADAWNALINSEDLRSQADATKQLTQEIVQHSSITGGVCIGGFVFEFADEWWKDGDGSPWRHDVGGVAPGGGPYPDRSFNEEWWGLVDIDRRPRPALASLREVGLPTMVATS